MNGLTYMNNISSEKISEKFLSINSCDCQQFCEISAGSNRPHGRIDWQIIFIKDGICRIKEDGNEIIAEKNSVIIYPPMIPQIYYFESQKNSVSYYIHFSGTECEKILKELKILDKRIIVLSENSSKIEFLFEKLITEFHIKKPFYEENCNGILLSIFSQIARNANGISENSVNNRRIYAICKEMNKISGENAKISDYAKIAGLSTGRFIHVFTKSIGVSPKRYIIDIKVTRARELLENTDLSICQISEILGYSDSNYFSRIFKKHTGHSPTFYR